MAASQKGKERGGGENGDGGRGYDRDRDDGRERGYGRGSGPRGTVDVSRMGGRLAGRLERRDSGRRDADDDRYVMATV